MNKLLVIVLMTWISSAHAYIDPGSGLLLIQGLLAALVSVVVFVRHPIEGIKKLMRKCCKRHDA